MSKKLLLHHKFKGKVFNWYHMHLLNTVKDRTEETFCQHFYMPGLRQSDQKVVRSCDNFQFTKRSNEKCGKLPRNLDQ